MSPNQEIKQAAFVKDVEASNIDEPVEDGQIHPLSRTLKLWNDANGFANTAFLTKVTIRNWVNFAANAFSEGASREQWFNRAATLLRCFGRVFDGGEAGLLGRDIVEMNLHCVGSLDIRVAAVLTLETWCENDEDGTWISMMAAHQKRENSQGLKDYCIQVLDGYNWGVDEDEDEDDQLNLLEYRRKNRCDPSKEDTFDALFRLYQNGKLDLATIMELTDLPQEAIDDLVAREREDRPKVPVGGHLITKEEHQPFLDVAEKYRDNVISGHISTERVPKFLEDNLGIHPHLSLDLLESYKIQKVSTRSTNINIIVGRMHPACSDAVLYAWTDKWAFSMTTHKTSDWLIGVFS